MAVSVRMDRLLEKELELAAQRLGMTKSQFIINAVERALDRKNPIELMDRLKAEEEALADPAIAKAFEKFEQPYDTEKSRAALRARLEAKHLAGRAG